MEQTDNSQKKVEVIVNHQGELDGEISLLHVFSHMAHKKKVYLRVLAILLILGLIIPMLMAELNTTPLPDSLRGAVLEILNVF